MEFAAAVLVVRLGLLRGPLLAAQPAGRSPFRGNGMSYSGSEMGAKGRGRGGSGTVIVRLYRPSNCVDVNDQAD